MNQDPAYFFAPQCGASRVAALALLNIIEAHLTIQDIVRFMELQGAGRAAVC